MEIKQKKSSNKHTFTFKDDVLNFAYEDKSGSGDFDMHYADFPDKSSISIEQKEWLRNVGFLWCLLGVFQIGYAISTDSSLAGTGFWLMLGLVSLAWAYLTKIKYSVFMSEPGNIFIIHDSKHDEIISEINKRKKEQLLSWYGEINLENDLKNEISKFNWLKEQNVISKEEADTKIAQVELAHSENFELPGERLN